MGHEKDLLSALQRSFERIFLLFCSFGNPLSDFVGVNGVEGCGGGMLASPPPGGAHCTGMMRTMEGEAQERAEAGPGRRKRPSATSTPPPPLRACPVLIAQHSAATMMMSQTGSFTS